MWLKQFHKPSPSHHHFYRWYVYHSQSWVVYDMVLPTLMIIHVKSPISPIVLHFMYEYWCMYDMYISISYINDQYCHQLPVFFWALWSKEPHLFIKKFGTFMSILYSHWFFANPRIFPYPPVVKRGNEKSPFSSMISRLETSSAEISQPCSMTPKGSKGYIPIALLLFSNDYLS